MRNNNSDFIQDSKQHSLHPYHLICMAAENILFTINPTTLSTNTAQNHSFTSLPPYTVVENSLSSKIAQKKLGRCGVRSCDLQITCSSVPNGMILDAVFLYSGLLSCPWMVATGLQGMKRPLFRQCNQLQACTSTRVVIQLLNLQPHATGAG